MTLRLPAFIPAIRPARAALLLLLLAGLLHLANEGLRAVQDDLLRSAAESAARALASEPAAWTFQTSSATPLFR